MLSLIALLLAEAAMNYMHYDSCPWTIEKAKYNSFIESVRHFMRILANTLFIYVTFVITIGFSIMRCDLSLLEIKVVFILTCSKFILSQLASSL